MGRFGGVIAMVGGVLALLAPAASAVVVRGPHGRLLGVTPHQRVAASQMAGAAGARATSSQSAANMAWHGGPVLHSSDPYLVFWDPGGALAPDWKSLVKQYFGDVAVDSGPGPNAYTVDRQYTDGNGFAGAGQTFSASTQVIGDGQAYPARDAANCPDATSTYCLTDPQIQQELSRLRAANPSLPDDGPSSQNLPQDAPVYLVVLPPNVDTCFAGGTGIECAAHDFCSYHSFFTDGGSHVLYVTVPTFVLSSNPKACQVDGNGGVQEPNGTLADVALKYITHDYAETITDPLMNAWYSNANSNEVADNCNQAGAFDPSAGSNPNAFLPTLGGSAGAANLYNQVIHGHNYYLQSEWSNGDGACDMHAADGQVHAQFTPPPRTLVTGTSLSFDPTGSSSSNPYSSVTWDWGDGSAPTFASGTGGPSPTSHTYAAGGTYTVRLTLVDNRGNLATASQQITVYSPPTAAFTITPPAAPQVGQDFSFTATASDPRANITGYSWDFGDGSPAGSGATASHPYQRAGTYTVTLTVTADDATSTTVTQQLTVGPVAAFTSTPAVPQNGAEVAFQSTSTDPEPGSPAIVAYSWDFGDRQSSTEPSPTHVYADPGTYTVTLTVTNSDGETDTVSHAITVADAPPTAAFTVTTPVPSVNQPVAFDGSESGPSDPRASIASYAWSFGDGATASGAAPTHAYASAGTYTVQLTVTDSYGASTTTQRQVLVHAPPTAAFTSSPGHPLEGTVVAFDGSPSRGLEPGVQVSSYAWSFGDGVTAAGSRPTHAYAGAGTYTVTLTVTNSLGLSATTTQRVSVVAPPRASFVVRTTRPATGQPVNFTCTSVASSYHWAFGDGSAPVSGANASHVFRRAGAYLVTLTVTDSFGHTAATTTRLPVAQAGRITKVTVRGTRLVVALNGPGTLNGAGRTIRVKRAGRVTLPIRLNAPERRTLALGHRLTLRLLVRFTPAAGPRLRKTVIVTFRPAHATTAHLAGA